jgi:hypothetical protein
MTSPPGLQDVSLVLASLIIGFFVAHSNDDHEEALDILEGLITFKSPRGSSGSYQIQASKLAIMLSHHEYSEETIRCCQTFLIPR